MTKTVYSDSSSSLLRESCRWDGEGGVHTCVAMYSDSSAILSREPLTGWVVKQQRVWSGDKKVCRYYQAGISSPAAAPNPIKTTATLQPPYLGEGVLNIRWTPPPQHPHTARLHTSAKGFSIRWIATETPITARPTRTCMGGGADGVTNCYFCDNNHR